MSSPNVGDTIRIYVEFKDFNGNIFDPSDVELRIYDYFQRQVGPTIESGEVVKEEDGIYYHEYTIPTNDNLVFVFPLFYEFRGTIRGKTALRRGIIDPVFADE